MEDHLRRPYYPITWSEGHTRVSAPYPGTQPLNPNPETLLLHVPYTRLPTLEIRRCIRTEVSSTRSLARTHLIRDVLRLHTHRTVV